MEALKIEESPVRDLIEQLSEPERHAVVLYKAILDCFNVGKGIGLMQGKDRHNALKRRVPGALYPELREEGTLRGFYDRLCREMLWEHETSKAVSERLMPLLFTGGTPYADLDVLDTFAAHLSTCEGLARGWHSADRKRRKEEYEQIEAEWREIERERDDQEVLPNA